MKKKMFLMISSLGFFSSFAEARVTRGQITTREIVAGGMSFGDTGPYEKLRGTVYFEVDPLDPRNPSGIHGPGGLGEPSSTSRSANVWWPVLGVRRGDYQARCSTYSLFKACFARRGVYREGGLRTRSTFPLPILSTYAKTFLSMEKL